jgi:uncharacterized protein (DUF58 family)
MSAVIALGPSRHWAGWRTMAGAASAALAVAGLLEGLGAAHRLPTLMVLLAIAWCVVATVVTGANATVQVAELDMPDECRASASIVTRLSLRNGSRWLPLMFASVMQIGFVPPRGHVDLEWRVSIRGRGTHRLESVSVSGRVPGSAFEQQVELGWAHSLTVLPAVSELRPNAVQIVSGRRMATGRLQVLPIAMEEYIGVRDYRPGDNPRLLHRVLSLRNPDFPVELVVREFEDPSIDDVCLVIDHVPPARADDVDAYTYRLEKALCFAVALARALVAQKLKLRVVVPGHPTLGERGSRIQGESGLWRLERELAFVTLSGDGAETDRTLYREGYFGNASVLFLCLRETAIESRNRRLAVLSVLPDTVHALTRSVSYQ